MSRDEGTIRNVRVVLIGLLSVAVLWTWSPVRNQVGATHQPADKVTASGSALETMRVTALPGQGERSATVKLLTARLRTSKPTDLIFNVTAECALWTNVGTIGNDFSESTATVQVWITVDGNGNSGKGVVPVSGDSNGDGKLNDPDDGRVVFCNRAFRMETMNFNDDDADDVIRLFQRTRSANAFNWTRLNLGSGVHTIEIWARLVAQVDTGSTTEPGLAEEAAAAVGKRTVVVTPAKLANDAQI